jgi:FMN phosphatase YigB (HAD superfamily)
MIKAITIDLWGTLFVDGPGADEDYRGPRLAALKDRLAAAGVPVSRQDLEQAYTIAVHQVGRLWQAHRDVTVRTHVGNLLEAIHPSLLRRLSEDTLNDLVEVYSSPALMVPPVFDHAAKSVVEALASRGLVLCLISNIMRTPGAVLRKLLDR